MVSWKVGKLVSWKGGKLSKELGGSKRWKNVNSKYMTNGYLESLDSYRLENRRIAVKNAYEQTRNERFNRELENINQILKKRRSKEGDFLTKKG